MHEKFSDKTAQKASEGKCNTVQEYFEYEKALQLEENRDSKGELVWDELREGVKVKSVPEKMLASASEDVTKMYTNFAELSGMDVNELLQSFGMDEDGLEEIANETVIDIMIAKTIASKEGITMDDEYYKNALTEMLGEEESDESEEESREAGEDTPRTLEEMEEEYKESMGSRPRDEMLIERVKDFVGEHAKEGTAEELADDEDELTFE